MESFSSSLSLLTLCPLTCPLYSAEAPLSLLIRGHIPRNAMGSCTRTVSFAQTSGFGIGNEALPLLGGVPMSLLSLSLLDARRCPFLMPLLLLNVRCRERSQSLLEVAMPCVACPCCRLCVAGGEVSRCSRSQCRCVVCSCRRCRKSLLKIRPPKDA